MFNVRHYSRKIQRCNFCKKICTSDVWTHYEECEKVPEEKRKPPESHIMMVPSVEKDWKDFIERKFEPHTFRARWNNIVCPFCYEHCKDIYHTFVCAFVPECRKKVNKRIAFWKS